MTEKPNILFVLSDQMRASAMGPAGNEDIYTPNFDRMSQEGTHLSNTYTNNPVCTPSRACLLSGQYSVSTGVVTNDIPLPSDIPTIGNTFQEAGYHMGYIGKWHLDGVPRDKFTPPGPRRQGFSDLWAAYNCSHDYFNPKYYTGSGELIKPEGYEPEIQTTLAIDFLDDQSDHDDPFCLFLSWGPPHDPYELVPDEYQNLYNPADLDLPPNVRPLDPNSCTLRGPPVKHWGTAEEFNTGDPYDYNDPREVLADYYAAITALDDQFSRLLDSLQESGQIENTIIVYTSDHGDNLWSHGQNQKGLPYEESVNIPFLIRWPEKIPANTVNETLLGMVDIAPTILGLADVDPPESMTGLDLSEPIATGSIVNREPIFMMGENWRAVRDERYTFARYVEGLSDHKHIPDGDWLLYDNHKDPYQLENRIFNSDYQDIRDRLIGVLKSKIDELNDPFCQLPDMIRKLNLVEEWNAKIDWFHTVHEGYDHEIGYLDEITDET